MKYKIRAAAERDLENAAGWYRDHAPPRAVGQSLSNGSPAPLAAEPPIVTIKPMNDALFRQHAEASVERAIRPWRRLLKRPALEAMRDFLRDLVFTHPRFVATLEADLARPLARAAAREAEHVANDVAPENAAPCPSLDGVVRVARERRTVEKRNELVCTARRAVAALARKVARRWNADADDLQSIGMLAVIEAADDWDAGRSSFTTFAWRRARSRMLDSLCRASARLEKPWAGELVDDSSTAAP